MTLTASQLNAQAKSCQGAIIWHRCDRNEMKARLTIFNSRIGVTSIILGWDDIVDTNNGKIQVKNLSVFKDKPIFDKLEYKIMHMLSSNDIEAKPGDTGPGK